MKFVKRQLLGTAIGIAGLIGVGVANAATTNLGTFNVMSSPIWDLTIGGIAPGANQFFTDYFLFGINGDATSSVSLSAARIGASGMASFDVYLYKDTGLVGDTGEGATELLATADTFASGSGARFADFSDIFLSVVDTPFFLKVVGTTLPNSVSAGYTGNMAVMAVPEPGTFAMLLAGLGMMGFIARRRTRNLSSFA